jgi:hypothetical protein
MKRETMEYKRRFATLAAALIAAVWVVLIPARGLASCDATSIAGNYSFKLHELLRDPTPSGRIVIGSFVPAAFVGQMIFTPATGQVTGFRTGNEGGLPLTNAFNTPTAQSTYSVNSDCTGALTLILDDGSTREYGIVVVQGGAEIELAVQSASFALVSDGVAKKQPATCDATTVAGDFGVRFNRLLAPNGQISGNAFDLGTFMPADSAGQIHFDPTTSPSSISGQLAGVTDGTSGFASAVAGVYSVSSNCTGTLTFIDNEGVTKELAMAIVQDGVNIEIEFANATQPGAQIVGEGVGKKL